MRQFELVGNSVKLVLEDNILAVLSGTELRTVSSAIHNGGFRNVKTILNVQVPEGYDDKLLHHDPLALVWASSRKIGVKGDFVGMITAAKATNFSLVTKKGENLAVSVIATAGCSHAETAGEEIKFQNAGGTVNIMVIIDGNPTESCLVATLLTATEAKTAALNDLDIRSRYSGGLATGTVTDSLVAAATNRGPEIVYGGPSSKLGQLIGQCVRTAVTEAVMKQDGTIPCRSILKRLKERHLPIEKLAAELSKIRSLKTDEKTLTSVLIKILETEPLFAVMMMSAVKISEGIPKELIPPEFGQLASVGGSFGNCLFSKQNIDSAKTQEMWISKEEFDSVDLPPFLKEVLVGIVKNAFFKELTENLK